MVNNRRNFIKFSGLTGISFLGSHIISQDIINRSELCPDSVPDPDIAALPEPLNRFPRAVHEYFVRSVRDVEQKGNTNRWAINSRHDAEIYVQEVREKISQCFGPWPEKTSLNVRITGIIERGAYYIEKVIFNSRPDFPVTANLYVPKGRKFPLPAVIGTCGHSDSGKAYPEYQSFAQGLVLQGYIVLIYDPIGQGERLQYLTGDFKPRYGVGVTEHLHAGNQMFLTGESLNSWFTWDGIRAVDYLLSRTEVDPDHIGVTGNSGGGTQATWLCGVEPRLTMAAPSCFITTFLHNVENELAADTEQCPWHALKMELDHSDFIAAMAPKPVILLGQEKDFFDIRGLEESFGRLKHLYKLLGAENNIQLFIGSGYHGYSREIREAMYSWFNKVTNISNTGTEPALSLEKEETLWCTPNGQVAEFNPRTVFSFTSQLSASLKSKRRILQGDELKEAIISTLKLHISESVPGFRILRPIEDRSYPKKHACSFLVETDPYVYATVYRLDNNPLYSRPPRELKQALLYVSHQSADEELRKEKMLAELIANSPDLPVFTCDVRGVGESRPNTCGNNFLAPYGSDYFYAIHSIMLDYPYLGQKTYDVICVINWLKSFGYDKIHLVGKGWGSIPATFAALISDTITKVTLKNALTSYSDVAEHEDYNWPLATLLPGVLKNFDLPDCYNALKVKDLIQIEPWNGLGK
jgi:dienelactone hydrolase